MRLFPLKKYPGKGMISLTDLSYISYSSPIKPESPKSDWIAGRSRRYGLPVNYF